VTDGPLLGGEAIASLHPGMIVDVLEVVYDAGIDRVRASLKEPQGWISLQNLSNGDRYVEDGRSVQAYSSEGHDTVALSLKATGALQAKVPNGTLLTLVQEDSDVLVVKYDGKLCTVSKRDSLSNLFGALDALHCEF